MFKKQDFDDDAPSGKYTEHCTFIEVDIQKAIATAKLKPSISDLLTKEGSSDGGFKRSAEKL